MFIDTHCHIQFRAYDADREAVIKNCQEKQVILNLVGTQKDTSAAAVALASKYENMYASIGTHPIHLFPTHVDEEESHFMSREEGFDEAHYENLVRSEKVIGVGETGLDLYHLPKDKPKAEVLAKQKQVFLAHIKFAVKHNLPLVVHCREAHNEMIELLQSIANRAQPMVRGVIHCFTGNWEQAQKYLALGFYLGFTGVVTYPPKKTDPKPQNDLLAVLKKMPADRILVETDSPYLAPQICRGKRCDPDMVEEVVKKIAEIRGANLEKIRQITVENTLVLFTRIKT